MIWVNVTCSRTGECSYCLFEMLFAGINMKEACTAPATDGNNSQERDSMYFL